MEIDKTPAEASKASATQNCQSTPSRRLADSEADPCIITTGYGKYNKHPTANNLLRNGAGAASATASAGASSPLGLEAQWRRGVQGPEPLLFWHSDSVGVVRYEQFPGWQKSKGSPAIPLHPEAAVG